MRDADARETQPPSEVERELVATFEHAARLNENDARLEQLERLRPLWEADRGDE